MIRAIPRQLLIHSAVHKYNPVKDAWGNPAWSNSRAISKIRIEPSSSLVRSKDNKEIQLRALMFFDRRNSLPSGAAFGLGDCISWLDTDYTIVAIDYLYDHTRLHHLEVGLV